MVSLPPKTRTGFQCGWCQKRFESLTDARKIPRHTGLVGNDKYVCHGSNKPPR